MMPPVSLSKGTLMVKDRLNPGLTGCIASSILASCASEGFCYWSDCKTNFDAHTVPASMWKKNCRLSE
jgi:hypothetical protein